MNTTTLPLSKLVATVLGIAWCHIQPSLNFVAICFFAMTLDCYTAYRCNRRIYRHYEEAIKKNPKCKMDGKLRSRKMAKMVQDFSVLVMAIFLAGAVDKGLLSHMGDLHLANYLSAIYCVVQFVSVLENESTCNGSAWAKVLQRIVADKTERHFDLPHDELQQILRSSETDEEYDTDNTNNANNVAHDNK